MDTPTASVFIYAKACGMYANSFLGKRAQILFGKKQLPDLWAVLFRDAVPSMAEDQLARLMEEKAAQASVASVLQLVSAYDAPPEFLRRLLIQYDYANLKAIVSALYHKDSPAPFLVDLGRFSALHYKDLTNIAAITRNTPAAWFKRLPKYEDLIRFENQLDRQYYTDLWDSLPSLPTDDRKSCGDILKAEIVSQNFVWILRLRVYYRMTASEIKPMLIGSNDPIRRKLFCLPVIHALSDPLDDYKAWEKRRYAEFLNRPEEGKPWKIDPRISELLVMRKIYRLAKKYLRHTNDATSTLLSFAKLKQLEEYIIRVAIENIRLGLDEDQTHEFLGDAIDG